MTLLALSIMDVYKLRPSSAGFRKISRAAFEEDTKRRAPWYQRSRSGELSQFAVCPACDNPIQIIGLYRLPKSVSQPYGRHAGESIPRLARLDPASREACPYFKPRRYQKTDRKPCFDDQARKILQLLIDQFDRVVYLLGKQTGIWLTRKRLEDMLDTYRQMKGFMYMGATLINVPWIFAYMSNSFPLFYQKISDNPALAQAVSRSVPQAHIDERGRLTARKDNRGKTPFVAVEACFIHHTQDSNGSDGSLSETMTLVVTAPQNEERLAVYKETIAFDHDFFQRLICSKDDRHRQPNLVDLARSRLGDLLL